MSLMILVFLLKIGFVFVFVFDLVYCRYVQKIIVFSIWNVVVSIPQHHQVSHQVITYLDYLQKLSSTLSSHSS